MRIAVIFHCYYFDLLDEFFGYFSKIHQEFSLFVTLPCGVYSDVEVQSVQNRILSKYPKAVILYCDNYGADIYPCFCTMDYILGHGLSFDKYIKVHTKKSLWKPNKSVGKTWRVNLCSSIFNHFDLNLNLRGIVACSRHATSFLSSRRDRELENYYRDVFEFYNYSLPLAGTRYSVGTMFMIDGDIFEDFFKRNSKKPFNLDLFANHSVLECYERIWELLPLFYNREIHLV